MKLISVYGRIVTDDESRNSWLSIVPFLTVTQCHCSSLAKTDEADEEPKMMQNTVNGTKETSLHCLTTHFLVFVLHATNTCDNSKQNPRRFSPSPSVHTYFQYHYQIMSQSSMQQKYMCPIHKSNTFMCSTL